jgi:hypothetical protein
MFRSYDHLQEEIYIYMYIYLFSYSYIRIHFHMGAQKMKDQVQKLFNVLAFQGDKVGRPLYNIKSLLFQNTGWARLNVTSR